MKVRYLSIMKMKERKIKMLQLPNDEIAKNCAETIPEKEYKYMFI